MSEIEARPGNSEGWQWKSAGLLAGGRAAAVEPEEDRLAGQRRERNDTNEGRGFKNDNLRRKRRGRKRAVDLSVDGTVVFVVDRYGMTRCIALMGSVFNLMDAIVQPLARSRSEGEKH